MAGDVGDLYQRWKLAEAECKLQSDAFYQDVLRDITTSPERRLALGQARQAAHEALNAFLNEIAVAAKSCRPG